MGKSVYHLLWQVLIFFYLLHKFDFDIQEIALRLNIPDLYVSTIETVKCTSSAWSRSSCLQPEASRSWRNHDCEKQVSDKNSNPLSSEVIGIEDQIIIVFENIAMFRF